MEEIEPKDIIAWQNKLLSYKDEMGQPYSATYLKTIHSQLSAIFNHAVRFYHLPSNPAQKAGAMGSESYKEMLFWTKEEYLKFADAFSFLRNGSVKSDDSKKYSDIKPIETRKGDKQK